MPCHLKPGQTILFQGDSITDCGRSREDDTQLGQGYAALIAAWLAAARPKDRLRFVNRGVSGNRVADLKRRWSEDCIALRPDWVSILIGVNDTWRRYDRDDPTSVEAFTADYRAILQRVREEIDAELVLLEPFVLPTPEDRRAWREDLDPKIAAVRDLAIEFEAHLIPLDGPLHAAAAHRGAAFFARDGVHPSLAGHSLIAQQWLRTLDAIG